MRRTLLFGAAVLAVGGASILLSDPTATAAAHRGQRAVTVRPATGYPATSFRISFTAPDRSGTAHGMYRYYVVSASGPAGRQSCLSQAGQEATAPRAHARVRMKLMPGAGGWCVGTFQGTVTEQARPVCPYREVCPLYIVRLRTIGRFSFTVHHAPPGGDTTPPVFTGLSSAMTCTPGPQRPGETSPYRLSWHAAHDNVTPSSEIVYDVFESTTSGGEDFSRPSWTTGPGVTSFTTPALPSADPAYFVVRARDRAGNEDGNTIERAGMDPCL
jgi:hypothetical protein